MTCTVMATILVNGLWNWVKYFKIKAWTITFNKILKFMLSFTNTFWTFTKIPLHTSGAQPWFWKEGSPTNCRLCVPALKVGPGCHVVSLSFLSGAGGGGRGWLLDAPLIYMIRSGTLTAVSINSYCYTLCCWFIFNIDFFYDCFFS